MGFRISRGCAIARPGRLLLVRAWSLYRRRPLYQRALASREKALGPEHSDVATSLNNLIWRHFSYNQGQYAKAKPPLVDQFRASVCLGKKPFPGSEWSGDSAP